jgi:transcriptional repressor of cell division inhibition gene dicB
MRTRDAARHFGSVQNLAQALKVTHQAVYAWGEIVPKGRAYELQAMTGGALTVKLKLYEKVGEKTG